MPHIQQQHENETKTTSIGYRVEEYMPPHHPKPLRVIDVVTTVIIMTRHCYCPRCSYKIFYFPHHSIALKAT